jgi:hypothetical protein
MLLKKPKLTWKASFFFTHFRHDTVFPINQKVDEQSSQQMLNKGTMRQFDFAIIIFIKYLPSKNIKQVITA